jgi:hypothetical protein
MSSPWFRGEVLPTALSLAELLAVTLAGLAAAGLPEAAALPATHKPKEHHRSQKGQLRVGRWGSGEQG